MVALRAAGRVWTAVVVFLIGAALVWWGFMDSHCEWVRSDVPVCQTTLRGMVAVAIGGVCTGAGGAMAAVLTASRRGSS